MTAPLDLEAIRERWKLLYNVALLAALDEAEKRSEWQLRQLKSDDQEIEDYKTEVVGLEAEVARLQQERDEWIRMEQIVRDKLQAAQQREAALVEALRGYRQAFGIWAKDETLGPDALIDADTKAIAALARVRLPQKEPSRG